MYFRYFSGMRPFGLTHPHMATGRPGGKIRYMARLGSMPSPSHSPTYPPPHTMARMTVARHCLQLIPMNTFDSMVVSSL